MEKVASYLKNSTEVTSNSLAIITWIKKAATTVNLRRRLLMSSPHHNHNEAPPEWLHSKDRKLLQIQTQNLKSKAHIVVDKNGSGNCVN